LLEALYSDEGLVASGAQSQSVDQFAQLWAFRELLPEAASKSGKVYKYDISVPVAKFKEVTDAVRRHLVDAGLMWTSTDKNKESKVKEVIGYGHFGDGGWSLISSS
jgi:FAD/FMN-containing dehydrogenase